MNETSTMALSWDPLESESDPGMVVAAQRREIRNILKSYTGYYDLFAELTQNALDAVERRIEEEQRDYTPQIWIEIDLRRNSVSVVDNGCGMDEQQYRQFLRPNFSFKDGRKSRGNKGVGATYLGYGFNHLEVATKNGRYTNSGVLKNGRLWVEDTTESVPRPRVEMNDLPVGPFSAVDRGTSMVVNLVGESIRPRNLNWVGADNAETWLAVLRVNTPVGGVYLCSSAAPQVEISLKVINQAGQTTTAHLLEPRYLYPNEVMSRVADIREYLKNQEYRVSRSEDVSKIPPKYKSLHEIWGEWSWDQFIDQRSGTPINVRLEESEKKLARELNLRIRIFLAFSTDLWDTYSDKTLGLRAGQRLLKGGLQLCTRNMPQGLSLTIPMTNNIGFQNLAHVLVHFDNAEPDLGRKGFQPDQVRVAEKVAVAAVTAMRRYYGLLRKPGGAKNYDDELKLDDWKKNQVLHEERFPLVIKGTGLFLPTEELPIRSAPLVEQDVVALFNQMLSSGVIRGIQLISSSQYKQYDGLFRVKMEEPFERFILGPHNPLGIDREQFIGKEKIETVVKVLEYKYSLDGLIEELQSEIKAIGDVDLVIAWSMNKKWRQMFDVVSYLDPDHVHLRGIHGTTHAFAHSLSGQSAFEAIILEDLVSFLTDPQEEVKRQQRIDAES